MAVAALAIGCTGQVSDETDADTSTMHALLVVEQTVPAENKATARSDASVWFLRIAEDQDLEAATQLVVERLELPPVGACITVGDAASAEVPADMSPVQLEFAGDVHLQAGADSMPLTLRFFPDVANLVSGAMYTLRGQDDLALPFAGALTVAADGTPEFDPFIASATPPPLPNEWTLDGQPLPSTTLEVNRSRPLTLRWSRGDEGDVVYFDIDPVPAVPSERIRCALADNGAGEIPTMAIPETSEMNLAIHRSREVALRSEGSEVGIAHFDLSVTARVRIAP